MINRTTLLLICAVSVASGAPTGMVKRTKSGVPLFLVADFQIIERYIDDASSSEEFSGNSSSADSSERSKREANDKFSSPQFLLDYLSNTLAHRVSYPGEFERVKNAKLTNRQQKSYMEEDFSDNNLRILRSVPNKSPVEPAVDLSL